LREPWSALGRAQVVVITRSDRSPKLDAVDRWVRGWAPGAVVLRAEHVVEGLRAAAGSADPPSRGTEVILLSAIARPELLEDDLERMGYRRRTHLAYPDHHRFSTSDLAQAVERSTALGLPLVTTAKDLGRLRRAGPLPANLYVLEIRERLADRAAYLDLLLDGLKGSFRERL
jgi:tetraacyldisaccharide 4'-kinase